MGTAPPGISFTVNVGATFVDLNISVTASTTKSWSGAGADNNWMTAANWSGGVTPNAGDNLIFPAGAAQLSSVNNFPTGTSFTSITINAGGYTFNNSATPPNAVALTGALTVNTPAGNTAINIPVTSTAALSSTTTGGTLTLGVSDTFGSVLIGAGTLAFAADQTVTGTFTIGASAGATVTGNLDMTLANATVGGAFLVQTNSATANTITIGASKTLTLNGSMTIGFPSAAAAGSPTAATFTGGGTLNVNGALVQIGGATNANFSNAATLTMTGLSQFAANLGQSGNFRVGDPNGSSGTTPTGGGSTVLLAPVSTIAAGTLDMGGYCGQTTAQTLSCGSTSTTLNADTIFLGSNTSGTGGRGIGVINFVGATGTLTINSSNGIGAANLNVLNSSVSTGNTISATMDLTGHTSTLNLNNLIVGQQ